MEQLQSHKWHTASSYMGKYLRISSYIRKPFLMVAAINAEFFSSYFQMTQHSWKSSDLIEVKANLQRYISRIILFIKTAVSVHNSLDPGPQALAGLHHGVPVEEPQHLLHLLDQILDFVERLFNDPYFRFAPHKIAKKCTVRRAGRPNLLLLHLRNWP